MYTLSRVLKSGFREDLGRYETVKEAKKDFFKSDRNSIIRAFNKVINVKNNKMVADLREEIEELTIGEFNKKYSFAQAEKKDKDTYIVLCGFGLVPERFQEFKQFKTIDQLNRYKSKLDYKPIIIKIIEG